MFAHPCISVFHWLCMCYRMALLLVCAAPCHSSTPIGYVSECSMARKRELPDQRDLALITESCTFAEAADVHDFCGPSLVKYDPASTQSVLFWEWTGSFNVVFVSNVLSCSICSVLKSGIWQNRSLAYLKKKNNSSDNNRVLGCLNTITSKTPYMWKDFLKQILYGASNHTTQVSRLY